MIAGDAMAFRQTTSNGLGATSITMRTFLAEARLAFGGATIAANQFAAATARVTGATTASTPAIAGQTAALRANAGAAAGAAAAGGGAAAATGGAAVAGADGGLAKGLAKSFGPILVVSSVVSVIAALVEAFKGSDTAAPPKVCCADAEVRTGRTRRRGRCAVLGHCAGQGSGRL